MTSMRMLILFYAIQLVMPYVCANFKILGEAVAEKSVTKNFIEKKTKGQIKGMISMRMMNLSYTIQQVIHNIYTKFQNPRWKSS